MNWRITKIEYEMCRHNEDFALMVIAGGPEGTAGMTARMARTGRCRDGYVWLYPDEDNDLPYSQPRHGGGSPSPE